MTGREMYMRGAAFVFQNAEDAEDTIEFAPDWLSAILQEVLPYENALRRYDGRPQLEAAPVVTAATLDGEIDYSLDLTRVAIPYAIAAHIWRADDNDYRAAQFQQMYVAALADSRKAEVEDIEDIY